jgi:hypothetical protein
VTTAGHVQDAGHALVAALDHDVGRAERASELLPLLVPAHRDDALGPICFAESTPSRPTAPSPTTLPSQPPFPLGMNPGTPVSTTALNRTRDLIPSLISRTAS